MLVSVIIPNRNRRVLAMRAVLSVLHQTIGRAEIIVVDDASTEDVAPLEAVLIRHGGRMIRNAEPQGAARCRNQGIAAASAPIVAFLDSDDYWLPEKLESQMAMVHGLSIADPIDQPQPDPQRWLAACGLCFYREGQVFGFQQPEPKPGEPLSDYLYVRGGLLQTSALMLPTALARRYPFNADLPVHQDTDFVLSLEAAGVPLLLDTRQLTVMDSSPRETRITQGRKGAYASEEWFQSRATGWSQAARRGFLRRDQALRWGRAGRPVRGLWTLLRGWDHREPLRVALANAIRIIIGEKRAEQWLSRLRVLRGAAQSKSPLKGTQVSPPASLGLFERDQFVAPLLMAEEMAPENAVDDAAAQYYRLNP